MGVKDYVTLDLPTLAEQRAKSAGQPIPKGLPPVLERKEKKKTKQAIEDGFRDAIWLRDKSRSRATRKPLTRSAIDPDRRGQIHHVLKRSTHPDGIWEPSRGILLSATDHAMAETRCPQAPEHFLLEIHGPDDLSEPQTFTWLDKAGKETKRRIG